MNSVPSFSRESLCGKPVDQNGVLTETFSKVPKWLYCLFDAPVSLGPFSSSRLKGDCDPFWSYAMTKRKGKAWGARCQRLKGYKDSRLP
ncbi:hypothetical protein CDL15_Pgr020689 [Punica granatum]|uniref:Uncharacterized protein n=1 Tax=Punica granatum TaxID=22663 RepID=A0A218WIH6_PUNGR|nr:hypothetical protein CDL15_Pgr020689 [Punica granatum]